ncbi:response regulator receiver domain-containing protein [Mycetohabitans endofungorum]|uniref:Response regulator receiver domain-containing protein n=1 Tax=Mycetohabitans endofungorum TaxID=417203 RepID=A0A2P5KCP9_9BURK|nr:response regulator receiver domain-containing protein [Mycetohabitans endofungorum]
MHIALDIVCRCNMQIRKRRKGEQVCAAGTKTRPCAFFAENDSILADGLIRSLRHSGYATDHVKTGAEADVALSMQSFDPLVLNLGLPRMSGLDVLRRLRQRNSNRFASARPQGGRESG